MTDNERGRCDDGTDEKYEQFKYLLCPLPHEAPKEEKRLERIGLPSDNFFTDTAGIQNAIHLKFSKKLESKPVGRMELIASIVASCTDRSHDCNANGNRVTVPKDTLKGKRKLHICKTCEYLCKTGAQYLSKKMFTFQLRESVSNLEEERLLPENLQDEECSKSDSNIIVTPSRKKHSIMMNTLNGKVDALLRLTHPSCSVTERKNSQRKNQNGSTRISLESGSLITIFVPIGGKAFADTGISHYEACFRFMKATEVSYDNESHQAPEREGMSHRVRLLRNERTRKRTRFEIGSNDHGADNTKNKSQIQMTTRTQESDKECSKENNNSSLVGGESANEESPLLSLQHYSQRLTCDGQSQHSPSHEDPLSLYATSPSPERADEAKEIGHISLCANVRSKAKAQHERSILLSKLSTKELARLRDETASAANLSLHQNERISKEGLKAALLSMAILSGKGNEDHDTENRTFPTLLKRTRIKVKGI